MKSIVCCAMELEFHLETIRTKKNITFSGDISVINQFAVNIDQYVPPCMQKLAGGQK